MVRYNGSRVQLGRCVGLIFFVSQSSIECLVIVFTAVLLDSRLNFDSIVTKRFCLVNFGLWEELSRYKGHMLENTIVPPPLPGGGGGGSERGAAQPRSGLET